MNLAEQLQQWDTQAFLYLNGFHTSFFDTVMWWVSMREVWIPLYLIILYFIIKKHKWQSIVILLLSVGIVALSDYISVHFFKDLFERLRPCHNSELAGQVHLVKNYCGGQYGFISSHAANTFALATITSYVFKNTWYSISIILWALIVSYSRIYLGVHYPGDVIGGIAFGILLAYLMLVLYRLLFFKLAVKF